VVGDFTVCVPSRELDTQRVRNQPPGSSLRWLRNISAYGCWMELVAYSQFSE
jgi:hypothetical protein